MIQTSQMTLEEFNEGAERWRQQCLDYINALLLENKRNERNRNGHNEPQSQAPHNSA